MPLCEPELSESRLELGAIVRRVREISTLPQVAMRVIEVASNPESTAVDLKAAVETDPALGARILRCVNSSAYALRVKISNLQQAIAYLGLKQIRNLAMTASVSELFRRNESIGPYRRAALWRHLVYVGICARLIAMRRGMKNFEDAFLAGLLHDLGIVLEDEYLHEEFCAVIKALDSTKTLAEVEQSQLGFDHTILAARLADTWRFPPVVVAAMRHHHAAACYEREGAEVVRCVEAANLLCTLKGVSSIGMKLVRFSPEVFAALDLTTADIAVLAEDLEKHICANAALFEV
jgi:putative nucleotidyltransferase with HDIG domain